MIHANFHDEETEKYIYLSGVLSSATKPDLDQMIESQKGQSQNWFFDLHGLEAMTGAGLQFFFDMSVELKNMGQIVAIRNANQQTMELLRRSGLDRMIRIG